VRVRGLYKMKNKYTTVDLTNKDMDTLISLLEEFTKDEDYCTEMHLLLMLKNVKHKDKQCNTENCIHRRRCKRWGKINANEIDANECINNKQIPYYYLEVNDADT